MLVIDNDPFWTN